MESLWFLEYDVISLETEFVNINFTSLLEQAVSDPEALNLSHIYTFSNNKFEHALQKYLSEFLEVFKNFFQDLLEISENENITNFSKTVLLYIQVERIYFLLYWRILSVPDFVLNRLLSSYLRIKNLLSSFHFNCFPKLYRSKELNETAAGSTGPRHRKRYSLTRTDQGSYDILFKRNEELKFFQNYLCKTFGILIKECKKQKNKDENISNFFKKLLHYSENIINKNAFYLKQENENLFGNTAEKQMTDRIWMENKTKSEQVRREIEREKSIDANRRNKNTSFGKSQTLASHSSTININKEKGNSIENKMIKSIIEEAESIQRKISIKLTQKEEERKLSSQKKIEKKTMFGVANDEEEKIPKSQNTIKSQKSKIIIPPPPPLPPAIKAKEKFIEDPLIRESIMKSLTNYFSREKDPQKYSKFSDQKDNSSTSSTAETLIKIKSNITDIIDEKKINKYKTLNDKLHENLEKFITQLSTKRKALFEAYQKMLMDNNDLMFRDSKEINSFLPQKHHSIEMVSGNNFENYELSYKGNNNMNFSMNEENQKSLKNKTSDLNVIKEAEETKERKGTDSIEIEPRNTHTLTALSSPLLRQSQASTVTNSISTTLWNFIRKSIMPNPAPNRVTNMKSKFQNQTQIIAPKVPKLYISEKDIIKIDSNTEIFEELKYVKTNEKMTENMIKDEDLFGIFTFIFVYY